MAVMALSDRSDFRPRVAGFGFSRDRGPRGLGLFDVVSASVRSRRPLRREIAR
jgi:hypothetical protein